MKVKNAEIIHIYSNKNRLETSKNRGKASKGKRRVTQV